MPKGIPNEKSGIDVGMLKPEEKRALALKLLGETDTDAVEAIRLAEQERDTQTKLDMAQQDEEKKQRSEKHYWIEIPRRSPEDTEPDVFVGAAGVSYIIQKDVPVPVPQSVLNVLDNAVIYSHVPIVDEARGVKYVKKVKYKRYPYSRLSDATPEEVAQFRAKAEEIRKANDDISIGQEMAKVQLIQESMAGQEEPFIPAYLREQEESPV